MSYSKNISLAFTLLAFDNTYATPVVIETPSASIIVIRALELWNGDKSRADSIMESVRKRQVSYSLLASDGTYFRGSPLVFQGISDNPVTKGVEARLKELNFKLARNDSFGFLVSSGVSVDPKDMNAVLQAQESMYKKMVLLQGDPATLESRVATKKFIGGVVSLAMVAVSMEKFGAVNGIGVADSIGLPDAVYRSSYQYRNSLAPVVLPSLDFSAYKEIEIRTVKVDVYDRLGQIIIAYKELKTPALADDALITAIVASTTADSTPAEVEKARANDRSERLNLWTTLSAQKPVGQASE